MGALTRSAALVALAFVGITTGAAAPALQVQSVPEVTAGYLVNFVKFTTWPLEVLPEGATIVVCVAGDSGRVAKALTGLTQGAINGRSISVRKVTLTGNFDDCALLYGADLNADSAQLLIRATSNRPIFTVGALSDFAERGGIANLFVDDGRLRFAVNPTAAARARLQISSKLLSMARIVGL
ncbi:MAG: YfiR family protein [Vicinamibacterales bacterium]